MAYMLPMPTGKLCYPMILFIQMKSNNGLLHLFTHAFEFRIFQTF